MKTMRLLLATVLLLGLAIGTGLADSVPLPTDIQITPPNPSLPAEVKAFFGKSGKWSGHLFIPGAGSYPSSKVEVIIIIEYIDAKEAKIIYATGDCFEYKDIRKEWQRLTAEISKQRKVFLSFPLPSSSDRLAEAKFWVKDDTLRGERTARAGFGLSTSTFTMKPLD